MRSLVLACLLTLAGAPSAFGAKETWFSNRGLDGRAGQFLVQVPRHAIRLEGKPAALFINCSRSARAIVLYAGDEPESLLARVRNAVAARPESCEVRWTGADGRSTTEWWILDRRDRLLVAPHPAALYAEIMTMPSWGPECRALHIGSHGDEFSPSHLEEGTSQPADEADSTAAYHPDSVLVEQLPVAVTKVPPEYPDFARDAGIQGLVLVQALVGKAGEVERLNVVQSIPDLDRAALDAVQQWKFTPASTAGKPLAVWVMVPVRFRLH